MREPVRLRCLYVTRRCEQPLRRCGHPTLRRGREHQGTPASPRELGRAASPGVSVGGGPIGPALPLPLDELERSFTEYDRQRSSAPSSRDRLINGVRRRYLMPLRNDD